MCYFYVSYALIELFVGDSHRVGYQDIREKDEGAMGWGTHRKEALEKLIVG